MNELQKFILAYLGVSLGLTKTELEDKVKELESSEEIRNEFMNLHKAKVSELKKTAFDDGHKKAAKNTLTKHETEIKEKFGIESDKQGLELIEEVVKANTPTETGKELSDEDIKKHPLYLGLEKQMKQSEKKFQSDLDAKVKEIESGFQQKETKKTVAEKALALFVSLNPVLSTDPAKAEKQKALFRKEIEAGNYQIEGDEILILNGDGSRREDGHGNAIKFEDYAKSTADELGFDYKVAETERDSSGDGNGGNGSGNQTNQPARKYTGKMPTNQAEYEAIAFNPAIPYDQKAEVAEAWQKQTST